MDRWANKCAIVTGAACGIGKAIATALLKNKVNVLALDINIQKLSDASLEWKQLAEHGKYYSMRCDVTNKEDLEAAFNFMEKEWNSSVDIMVNNAGVVEFTRVIESDTAAFERLLNINVLATAVCINRAVRSMRQRNVEGHIFNINSVAGYRIPPVFLPEIDGCNGWNLYPTCKHGTVALTHTVRQELTAIKAPIRITSINPGIVKTAIADHEPRMAKLFETRSCLVAEDVADAVIYALGCRPEVQITELTLQHTGEDE